MNLRKTNLYTEITMTKNEFVKAFYMEDKIQIHLIDPKKSETDIYVKRITRLGETVSHYMAHIIGIIYGEDSIMVEHTLDPEEDGTQLVRIGYRTEIIFLIMIAKYMVEVEGYEVK